MSRNEKLLLLVNFLPTHGVRLLEKNYSKLEVLSRKRNAIN